MISRLRRWVRSRLTPPPYEPGRDPIVRELRAIRSEAITATRQSNAALRQARQDTRDLSETMRVPPAWHRQPPEGRVLSPDPGESQRGGER